ncbi:hypothetical protein [Pararhodobacter marinus]|uniref:hypothetical protein n=1 Tax=Pararhodobacter marinus TaxID=2184063 RepID=UPI0035164C4D
MAHSAVTSGVWFHATEPASFEALSVLAAQTRERKECDGVHVTGGPGAPGPGDDLRSIDAVFDHFPARLLVLGGDALPLPIIERARARGVRLMLVDTADPAVSGGWRLLRGPLRSTLARFELIHARDAASAASIARDLRGRATVLPTGRPARFGATPGCNMAELDSLRETIGARPVWLAQGLPLSELDGAFLAQIHALRRAHRLLMIVMPCSNDDEAAIAQRASEVGITCARRLLDEEIDETTQVYVTDAEDDPGLFLRLASVTYLGGTLSPDSATPPALLPASLGSALVFGPAGQPGQRELLGKLRAIGAGRQIPEITELGPAISALLSPEIGAEQALRAWSLATDGAEATERLVASICDCLKTKETAP